jgi:hypothetical protein
MLKDKLSLNMLGSMCYKKYLPIWAMEALTVARG